MGPYSRPERSRAGQERRRIQPRIEEVRPSRSGIQRHRRARDTRPTWKRRTQAAALARALTPLIESVIAADWECAWLAQMSIRTPWAVMKGDIENHFHDVDNGVCKSTETHEYVRNLDALVRARGSKAAFLTLHPEDRAQCVEVALEELCALGAFRRAGGSDESWGSLDCDQKDAWVPKPDVWKQVRMCASSRRTPRARWTEVRAPGGQGHGAWPATGPGAQAPSLVEQGFEIINYQLSIINQFINFQFS